MLKQDFDVLDYMGAPIVALIFGVILFVLCVIFNFTLITKRDDLTAFEKAGIHMNLRLGPHSMAVIRRGGIPSSFPDDEPLKVAK